MATISSQRKKLRVSFYAYTDTQIILIDFSPREGEGFKVTPANSVKDSVMLTAAESAWSICVGTDLTDKINSADSALLIFCNLAWVAEYVEEFFLPHVRGPDVLEHVHIFMEIDVKWIGFVGKLFSNAIDYSLLLWLKGAKHAIPQDEGGPEILIHVFFL